MKRRIGVGGAKAFGAGAMTDPLVALGTGAGRAGAASAHIVASSLLWLTLGLICHLPRRRSKFPPVSTCLLGWRYDAPILLCPHQSQQANFVMSDTFAVAVFFN